MKPGTEVIPISVAIGAPQELSGPARLCAASARLLLPDGSRPVMAVHEIRCPSGGTAIQSSAMEGNVYFELTRAFNDEGRIAILASGQAVVYYRVAMMSKDGDWILRETDGACAQVLDVLGQRGARYRPGAPLDLRWLRGGWSSHFELADAAGRRVRCDFFSRPPRIPERALERLFEEPGSRGELDVVGLEELIRMKRTQRAKDYPVIGELARRLPPEREVELTTDPDRVLALAAAHGAGSERRAVVVAREGRGRWAVVVALAEEADRLQRTDRRRVARYERAAAPYLTALRRLGREVLTLPGGHDRLIELAEELLPTRVTREEVGDEAPQ